MTTTTITAPSDATTVPDTVNGYDTSIASQNIIHDLIGGGIAVALIRPRPRAGRLELIYVDPADAFAALTLHEEEGTFTLEDTDLPALDMSYVVAGAVSLSFDTKLSMWRVSVGYQEVEA